MILTIRGHVCQILADDDSISEFEFVYVEENAQNETIGDSFSRLYYSVLEKTDIRSEDLMIVCTKIMLGNTDIDESSGILTTLEKDGQPVRCAVITKARIEAFRREKAKRFS